MRVLIPVDGYSPDSTVARHLGRAPYHLVIDTGLMDAHVHPNPAVDRECNAGVEVALFAASQKIEAVVALDFGPKVWAGMRTAKIDMYFAEPGQTGQEAARALLAQKLEKVTGPSKECHAAEGHYDLEGNDDESSGRQR